jgi:hypothetical protein
VRKDPDALLRIASAVFVVPALASAQVVWTGRVVDQNETPVAQALVKVRQENSVETTTPPSGQFRLTVPAAGHYLISVERAGYFALKDKPVDIGTSGSETVFVLNA